MRKIGLFCLAFGYLIFCLFFPEIIKSTIINTSITFVIIIMPSILPMYFIGNILLSGGYISKCLFPLLHKFMHFENSSSCSIYLLSLIMGNPTTSILINNALNKNLISLNESKRLMKLTFFMNPLFIITVCGIKYSLPIIIGSLLTSFIIGIFPTHSSHKTFINNTSLNFFEVINNAPNMLLNILMSMLIVSIIKTPLTLINQSLIASYLGDLLDISSGLINVATYNIPSYYLIILLSLLINSNGLCLLFQTKQKATFISLKCLLKYRLNTTLLATLITIFFYFLFNC